MGYAAKYGGESSVQFAQAGYKGYPYEALALRPCCFFLCQGQHRAIVGTRIVLGKNPRDVGIVGLSMVFR